MLLDAAVAAAAPAIHMPSHSTAPQKSTTDEGLHVGGGIVGVGTMRFL